MKVSDNFFRAVCDYRYLLERDYPQKSMLKLVGDRYALPAAERVMLYRGLATENQVKNRKEKVIRQLPPHTRITIDGFNVCRTVGSYLNGNPVFVGMDGLLRDVSELHRKKLKWEVLEKAVDFILQFLAEKQIASAWFYFDTPISHSGKMCALVNSRLPYYRLSGTAETVFSPDYELIQTTKGVLCTADSNIIENAQVKVYDLAQQLILERFSTKLFSLKEYLSDNDCPDALPPDNTALLL